MAKKRKTKKYNTITMPVIHADRLTGEAQWYAEMISKKGRLRSTQIQPRLRLTSSTWGRDCKVDLAHPNTWNHVEYIRRAVGYITSDHPKLAMTPVGFRRRFSDSESDHLDHIADEIAAVTDATWKWSE